VVEEQTRPWTWRPRRFGAEASPFPYWFRSWIDMRVISGNCVDDYGTVLWGGAALWSKLKLYLAAVCLLRSDLIDIVSPIRML